MSFDLSRIRFDARRDFLGVVMQQGRVQLDADWNEWGAQLARRLQAGSLDTFDGPPGSAIVPRTTPDGFRIEAEAGGLTIGPGRLYVDGLLAENHGGSPETWEPRLAEASGSAPLAYADQPYYPDPPALPEEGTHLVYLDVWQRDVTALQAPDLIEPAIGIDTTGRRQTVWQVKVLPGVGDIGCTTAPEEIPGWSEATAPSAARLSTATGELDGDPDPCRVPPAAGYRGLENQLYRVEVHTGGPLGIATFKWSRDNVTVASRVTHINAARDRLTVESIGRDDILRFHDGDWVEVTDDWRELHNLPGELRRLRVAGGVDETGRTLSFDPPLPAGLFPTDAQQATVDERHTRVRRWDQAGQVRHEDGSPYPGHDLDAPGSSGEITIPPAGTRLFLEHGILVEFSLDPAGGDFHGGDHWVFAARSATGDIERLDTAPPRGIHHHYARLAVVDFPEDDETDCRLLWPPAAEGESCDCSVCVSADGHNDGTATLQQAIDSIREIGGTLCLGIGRYEIEAPLDLTGARSLRLRGQGWGTLLVGREPGGLLSIDDATGVALENLTLIGSGSGSGTTSVIAARNVVDLRLDRLNVLGLAVEDGTSVGLGLAGNLLGVRVADCAFVAERGIASVASGERRHLLSAELRLLRNLFFCSQRAVSLDGTCLHYGQTRLADNLMLGGNQAAIVATGATLPGATLTIADNRIHTAGQGIRAGVDGLVVEGNTIIGTGSRSGDGIRLEEGLDPQALTGVRIAANRLQDLQGHGIVIDHPLGQAQIADNRIEGMGLGALVMEGGGAAEHLSLTGNRCLDLGLALGVDGDETGAVFAGLQLIRVRRGDVLDNRIARVARQVVAGPGIDALRAAAVGQLRLAGNRFHDIGPDRGAPVSAAHLPPPFEHLAIDDNHIERFADEVPENAFAEWRALDIAPEPLGEAVHMAAASYFATDDSAYLLTARRITALPLARASVAIRGNRLHGQHTGVPLNRCQAVDHCLFAHNHCEVEGQLGADQGPLLGLLVARTLDASHNRLIAPDGFDTLHLHPQADERAIVMGNTSSGEIRVPSGVPVPADITLTNIFGV